MLTPIPPDARNPLRPLFAASTLLPERLGFINRRTYTAYRLS